jgi:hypothetical protein
MKLLKHLRLSIISHYFIQMKNGKFLILEGMYIYMIFACMVMTYGTLFHYNTIQIIPFIMPFAFGFWQVVGKIKIDESSRKWKVFLARVLNPLIFSKITHIDELSGSWRTQLRLLRHPIMGHKFSSKYDIVLEQRLEMKFEEEYEIAFDDARLVNISKGIALVLVIACLMVVWFYK